MIFKKKKTKAGILTNPFLPYYCPHCGHAHSRTDRNVFNVIMSDSGCVGCDSCDKAFYIGQDSNGKILVRKTY